MEMLDDGGATVQGLAACLETTHQNVSRHLSVLHQAGIVSRRKRGTWVLYELVDWSGWWMVQQVGTSVMAQPAEAAQRHHATAQLRS